MDFADRIADIWLTMVPADQQRVKFAPMVGDIQQISATQKANTQTVGRLTKGEVMSFPLDLEDA